MDLLAQLPVIRRERGGVVILDRILFYVGWLAAGWAVIQMFTQDFGVMYGLPVYLVVLVLLPAWIHVRLWPRMAWVSSDGSRRDDLFLAGLARPRNLWTMFRGPLWRALFVPVSVDAILLAGMLARVLTSPDEYGMRREVMAVAGPGVLIALSLAALGLAGAADVFGRLCRGMARGNAVVLSVVWVFAATVALPFLFGWIASDVLRASDFGLLLGCAVGITGLYLLARRLGLGGPTMPVGRLLRSPEPAIAAGRVAVIAAVAALLVFGPAIYLDYETRRMVGSNTGWDWVVFFGFGLVLACGLLAHRVAFAVRAYQYGRDR